MHALAISPDLLIRLAKKNDAEEVPRQFALEMNRIIESSCGMPVS
jgi:hypothetical protein